MVLTVFAAIRGVDRSLMTAARSLGAPEWQVFLKVLLPLSLPGVWGGVLLVFVTSLGFYVTPAILGSPRDAMIAQVIDRQVNTFANFELATLMGLTLVTVSALLFTLYNRVFGLDRLWGAVER
jgi:ABC-type spermidine/putrescine transport system permease subunit I